MPNKKLLLAVFVIGFALAGCNGNCLLCSQNALYPVKISDKYGFINRDGKEIIENKYSEIKDFSEGLCAVNFNGSWGYIDNKGEFKIIPQYKKADNFKNGLAYVYSNDREGYIDKTGKFIWSKEIVKKEQQAKTQKAAPPVRRYAGATKADRDFVDKILNETSDVLP